ncbi:type IV toxin-antitoxin system AbiEi family antitoxin domain-containing protein [Microbacterium sp.]|uniref:type IV toxin-antitoxin system AbiEi family antitoxin domain-containing protein n=1 Tax=Microbacterium sp. TaxID=51671 RepID=UPI003A91B8C3
MTFRTAASALIAAGRIARTSALRARGVTAREIARALAAGEVVQVRRGVYATSDADAVTLHAARHGGAVACTEAGRMRGLWMLDDVDGPHIWHGHAGNPRTCGDPDCPAVPHWDEGTAEIGALPPLRNILLQIAVCAGEETFFAALESGLRQSMVTLADLRWLELRLPGELRWLLGFARSDADSGLESLIRLRLHRLGIEVRTQVLIDGVGEVDFVIGDWLIVEADGMQNHDDRVAGPDGPSPRHKDLQRDARAAALGYETLRFDYAMIIHHWEVVEAAILARVAAGAHRA